MSEVACGAEHCITCGDDGVPMRVLLVRSGRALAVCEDELRQARSTVEIALIDPPVAPGDRLLVHAGTAIARLQASRERI